MDERNKKLSLTSSLSNAPSFHSNVIILHFIHEIHCQFNVKPVENRKIRKEAKKCERKRTKRRRASTFLFGEMKIYAGRQWPIQNNTKWLTTISNKMNDSNIKIFVVVFFFCCFAVQFHCFACLAHCTSHSLPRLFIRTTDC